MPQTQLSQRIATGARTKIYLDGREVGHATDVDVNAQYNQQPVEELGDPIATAILTVGVSADMNFGKMRLVDLDPALEKLVPRNDPEAIIMFPEMECMVFDRITDKPLFKVIGCKPRQLGFRTGSRAAASENVGWIARAVVQPSEGL